MEVIIDTLKIYERLKAADLPEKASKEIAEVIKETVSDNLVTKQYLDLRLAELKSEIVKWVAGLLVAQAAVIVALVKLL
jgi:ribosomal protein S13